MGCAGGHGGVPLAKGTETLCNPVRRKEIEMATEVSPSRRGLKRTNSVISQAEAAATEVSPSRRGLKLRCPFDL